MTHPIATRLVNGERVPAWHLAPPRARQSVINQRGLSVIQKIRDIHTEQASLARELGQKPPTRAIVGISVFAGLLAMLALATIAADPAAHVSKEVAHERG